ncbi:hypothetical protein ACET3Z_005260 [Daucus carota]
MEFRDNQGVRRFFRPKDQLKVASLNTLKTLQSKLNRQDSDEEWFYRIFQKQIDILEEKLKSRRRRSSRNKEWKSDEDAVKMGKLYFLHHFLLTSSTDTYVPKRELDLLDGDQFDEFPWGEDVFKVTVESLKSSAKTTSKDNNYRLTGFKSGFMSAAHILMRNIVIKMEA